MKKLILLLLLATAVSMEAIAQQTISATIDGGSSTTIDCKSTATVTVNFSGQYLASVSGGAVIIDPDTGEEVFLLRTNASTLQVKAVYGSGTIYLTDQTNSLNTTSVELNVTDLETLIGSISSSSGGQCVASDGTMQLTVPVDSRAGDVTYRWSVVQGKAGTSITSGQGTNTVTISSSTPETAVVRVSVSNDCSAEDCSSPTRSFRVRKIFSAADKADIQIEGITCVTNPEDDVIVVAVPPVLGRYDETEYQWNLPASVQEEFRSLDGSAIAFSVVDPSQDIIISLDLGPTCNPGYTLYKTVKSTPQAAQVGIASEGYVASNTFCLSDDNTTTETFRILNDAPGYTYDWVIPSNWQILNANADNTELTIALANNSSGNITITSVNAGCGSEVTVLNVNRYPTTAPDILGTNCVAFGDANVLTFNVQGGDNTYTWEVIPSSAGWTLDPNQTATDGPSIDIIPDYVNIPASGNVTIRATIDGNCGGGAVTSELVVAVGPEAPAAINGPDCVQDPQQNITFSVDPVDRATSYEWSFSGTNWSIVNGQGTNQVEVSTGGNSGTIEVKADGCALSPIISKTVNVGPSQPGAISYYVGGAPADVCAVKGAPQSVTFSIPATVSGAASYTWSFPAAWNQPDITTADANTLSVTATTDNSTGGTVSVVANNTNGCPGLARTYDFVRSGLDFCVTAVNNYQGGSFWIRTFTVNLSSGNATDYVWKDASGNEFTAARGSNSLQENVNAYASIYVDVYDGPGCVTTLQINTSDDNTETSSGICNQIASVSSMMSSSQLNDTNLRTQSKFVMYPNPVNEGIVKFQIPSAWKDVTLEIYDNNGRRVNITESFEKTDGQIELRGNSKGVYHVIINSSGGLAYDKFVVK